MASSLSSAVSVQTGSTVTPVPTTLGSGGRKEGGREAGRQGGKEIKRERGRKGERDERR